MTTYDELLSQTKKQTLFVNNTIREVTQSMADYLPGGKLFEAKNIEGSNLRKLLQGLSYEIIRAEKNHKIIADNMIPIFADELIEEWELFLGIPDECFKVDENTTLIDRRKFIIAKLALMEVTKAEDWINLAEFFGYDIKIEHETDFSTIPLPVPFLIASDLKASKFTMIIVINFSGILPDTIPLSVPFTIGSSPLDFIKCLLNKVKPANTRLVFKINEVT
jgi:uncharacterized protein YmfQ (DUF2313 family)